MFEASYPAELQEIRRSIFALCASYDEAYWLERDESGTFPHDFVSDVAKAAGLAFFIAEKVLGLPKSY